MCSTAHAQLISIVFPNVGGEILYSAHLQIYSTIEYSVLSKRFGGGTLFHLSIPPSYPLYNSLPFIQLLTLYTTPYPLYNSLPFIQLLYLPVYPLYTLYPLYNSLPFIQLITLYTTPYSLYNSFTYLYTLYTTPYPLYNSFTYPYTLYTLYTTPTFMQLLTLYTLTRIPFIHLIPFI